MASNRLAIEAVINDKISGPLTRIRDKFDQLGKSKGAQSILGGVGLGVGLKATNLLSDAIRGASDFMGGAIDKASDLAETMSKVNIVFGSSADEIHTWGDKAASAMGLSKQAAEETAASFGNLFLGAGIGQKDIAGLSEKVVGLAADLASFNNLPTADVLEKLRAGLVGEAEPLRTLGVNLTAAQTDAEAAALGFKKVNGVFTEGQKIQARYSLILKSTTTAQGDFARTSDGLANSQKKLNAAWENMQAKIGEKLIPVVLELTKDVTLLFDLLNNPHPAQNIIDQTKAFVAQGVSVKDLDNSLNGLLQQQGELDKVFGMEASKRDLATVIQLVKDARQAAADTEAGVSTSFNDMDGAARKAMSGVLTTTAATIGPNGTALQYFKDFPTKAAWSLLQGQDDVLAAAQSLADAEKQPFLDQKTLRDALNGKGSLGHELLVGLNSKRPTVREAARKLRQDIIDQLTRGGSIEVVVKPVAEKGHPGGGRAMGGPVYAGETYRVGENGPETLVMGSQSGYVVPNGGNAGHSHDILMDGYLVARAMRERMYYDGSRASPSAVRK